MFKKIRSTSVSKPFKLRFESKSKKDKGKQFCGFPIMRKNIKNINK